VAINGADIVAVDTPAAIASRYKAAQTLDAAGKVVMPGLINTHTHAAMVMYRGLGNDLNLMDWLQKYIFPAEAKTVTPDFVRIGTQLALLEMIQSGTTTFADMYYFEEEVAKATKAAGMRGVLGQTVIEFPVADAKTPADALKRTEAFAKQFDHDELITPSIAPHSVYTLDAQTLAAVSALAKRLMIPIQIHLAETSAEIGCRRNGIKCDRSRFSRASISGRRPQSPRMACGSTTTRLRSSRDGTWESRTIPRAT
jgi:5-methylthioadenosine/S-adenosylhomocysteine deaminase